MTPSFCYEQLIQKKGFTIIAGLDEVGRGSLAGPVIAGAVIFAPMLNAKIQMLNIKIDDSKKLTVRQREIATEWIKEHSLAWGIGEASVGEINKLGISKATHKAFRRAISHANKRLRNRIQFILVDAFYIPYVRGLQKSKKIRKKVIQIKTNSKQLAIIKGDQKSFSIAAASIIAKVHRDELMIQLGKRFRKYGWDKNKGYGTLEHREAIIKYGSTRHHRKLFIETFLSNTNHDN